MTSPAEASGAPLVILAAPPVFDFALFDLFIRPYALLRLGKAFSQAGYRVELLDGLSFRDSVSRSVLGRPSRRSDGTGKLLRRPAGKPDCLADVPRRYYRYGMLPESMKRQLSRPVAEADRPDAPPVLLLVGTGMTYWYPGAVEMIRFLRRLFPRAPLVAGGIYATLCPEHCRSSLEPDHLVQGEALPELNAILGSRSLPLLAEKLPEDQLLLPEVLAEAAAIRLNRGCPFHCDYCASEALTGGFAAGSPDALFGLVMKIHRRLGTRNFAFYDDALLTAKRRLFLPFLRRIVESGAALRFFLPNALHLSEIDSESARLMMRAGFQEVRMGFESADPAFHRGMDVKLEVEMLGRAVEALQSAGFPGHRIVLYILAGLPDQSWREVESSIRFAAGFGVRISVAEYSPVPGTALWPVSVRRSRFPLEEEPLTHNNSILPMQWGGFTTADLQRLKDLARGLSPHSDREPLSPPAG